MWMGSELLDRIAELPDPICGCPDEVIVSQEVQELSWNVRSRVALGLRSLGEKIKQVIS